MDTNNIKELIDLIDGTDITELYFEKDGTKIRIRKGALSLPKQEVSNATSISIPDECEPVSPDYHIVTSPIVGTFYAASAPDSESFVKKGEQVTKGQILCVIEAMKLMNEIESEVDGIVDKILVENGQPVEYGEHMFHIKLS
ncbi:MAG: acetyl-CoA carboxylase biotin carboxyl carrier protein [Nitrospirae bacterium]|nr:acetyl-CoA carboxylase biotin carboxyl carrier protein [Nitrospirota bacterium]MBF0541657.1 acetyl-CoA carboxylase biotin carboxyl carrier protein [Nitrospirota bacterium]